MLSLGLSQSVGEAAVLVSAREHLKGNAFNGRKHRLAREVVDTGDGVLFAFAEADFLKRNHLDRASRVVQDLKDGQVLHQDLVAQGVAGFVHAERHVVLACFALSQVDDVDAGVVTHIGQVNVDDVQNFGYVISKGALHQAGVDNDATAEHKTRLLINLVPLENDRTVLSVQHLVDLPFVFAKLDFVLVHVDSFRKDLVGQAKGFAFTVDDLVLHNELVPGIRKHLLSQVVFFVLGQNLVVLLDHSGPNVFRGLAVAVVLAQENAVGVEQEPQGNLRRLFVVVSNFIN